MVGGNTAVTLDIAHAADHDRNLIIPITLALVFVILGLLLRAIVAPIMQAVPGAGAGGAGVARGSAG